MRRIIPALISTAFLLASLAGYAQSPPGINYQGIARNPDGKPLAQKAITIRINILKEGSNGEVEFSEVHSLTTNSFGLFTLVIGTGDAQNIDFRFISWDVGNKWLRVEMDPDGGNTFQLMGSQQFMSVPYAFYAKYSGPSLTAGQGIAINNHVIENTGDADTDPENEFNTSLVLNGKKLQLTDGRGVLMADLSALIPNGGAPQDLKISDDTLTITEGQASIDLSVYRDNTDEQDLSLSGTNLNISGGAGADLSSFKQSLSFTSPNLTISNGNSVNLNALLDNTDAQNLSSTASGTDRTISITNGLPTTINVADNDNSISNEIQDLSLSGSTLSLSGDASPVNLSGFNQNLSSSASGTDRTISITNGSPTTINVADNDNSTSNEIQDLSLSGSTLSLSGDSSPVDLSVFTQDKDEQTLSFAGTTLGIGGGNSVNLSTLLDDTDDQDLALNSITHSLSLSGDPTPVNLLAYMDNTDNQGLSMTSLGNTRTINIQNGTGVTFNVADGDADPTNELQSLTYNAATKNLTISTGNTVAIPETQTLNQVLMQGNDANGQKIANLGAPTANTDAATKQYVDAADAAINARLSANYAFKTNFAYSSLLSGSNVTLPLADGAGSFDDFNVVNATNFTAQVAGTYVFTVDGDISSILVGAPINLLYNGTKYPVSVGSNNRYNTTLMFRLTAGQTVSLIADGLGIGTNINGSFFGYKLP